MIFNEEALAENAAEQSVLDQLVPRMSEERDLMNQMLGQVQMARSISKFADVVSLTKLAHIKETKMYRALAGKKAIDQDGNEIADIGTWDGFCRAIGSTRSTVDEDLTNLRIFGEDALKQLNQVGAGYRELRQLRKLPDDERTALVEASKDGDKEAVMELIEDLVTRHNREKELLQDQLKSKEEEINAKVRREKDLNDQNHALLKKVIRIEEATPDEDYAMLAGELAQMVYKIQTSLTGLRGGFNKLIIRGDEVGIAHYDTLVGHVTQLHRELNALRSQYSLPIEPDKTDSERAFEYAEAVIAGNAPVIN
ncbi:hypothetical protein [Sulfuriferula multivorans]|uniref:hypothetical protein n=1 Tax=Sulfuriferula multivorans TaxID=1559896 RepID=UPI0016767879|nr:hypothetical protein [Sulfuriferula multivorans]